MTDKREPNGDFDAFVKSQQAPTRDNKPIDWARERDEWLRHLNELYSKMLKRAQATLCRQLN